MRRERSSAFEGKASGSPREAAGYSFLVPASARRASRPSSVSSPGSRALGTRTPRPKPPSSPTAPPHLPAISAAFFRAPGLSANRCAISSGGRR
ncbi:MAG: hypothetical protein AVDCRST_MAG13-1295 [uncultured Solirubrobacteraceae bacterium]|uniref:Uncharacterized protein n=1 Tax=uncultured Solirubrobacteraceae bacterium TaxID=1162706 RepID=A0A6J4S0H3_9ACTN|nr:MAG: hypothetical protein AVDCRST_MAG13-1295 [uncultured Solirubrobacteraceae bacterium]